MVTWREEARLCLYAVQFLTRLPVPAWVGHQEGDLERAVRYFPWVGALIGLIAGGVYAIAHLSLPGLVAAGLALTTSILLTGGFHEDGLADSWDGLGGGQTKDKALEIMRDSRLGTYGALAIGLSLILRIAALASLPPALGWVALIVAHVCGRTLVVSVIRFFTYARHEGLAKPVADDLPRGVWLFALVSGIAFSAFLGPVGIMILALAHLAGGAMLWVMYQKLSGYTGDGLGAIEQVGEITALLLIVAWIG